MSGSTPLRPSASRRSFGWGWWRSGSCLSCSAFSGGAPIAWLVSTNLLALTLALYGWAAFDVDAVIARFNVEHSREFGGEAEPLHASYLTSLGPSAIPAIDTYLAQPEGNAYDRDAMRNERNRMAIDALTQPADWRSWTWRRQRLVDYLLANPTAPREN